MAGRGGLPGRGRRSGSHRRRPSAVEARRHDPGEAACHPASRQAADRAVVEFLRRRGGERFGRPCAWRARGAAEAARARGAAQAPAPDRMRRWTRAVPWIGGVFIAAIIALAGYDIVDSYRTTVANTGRDLDAQARIIAEQTARSLQAVDVVLRYQVEQHRQGTLDAMSPRELHTYLRDQAVGLVQISGLVLVDASGAPRALSELYPVPAAVQDISGLAVFKSLSAGTDKGLYIGDALQSLVDRSWIFPLARRLETPAGGFAGGVGARGRGDYFAQFSPRS